MSKFYTVVNPVTKTVYQHHIIDFDKAMQVANKAAQDSHADIFILTSTHLVQAPLPEPEVTLIE
jgi:hypothetical protein